jgi:hypothetical protein
VAHIFQYLFCVVNGDDSVFGLLRINFKTRLMKIKTNNRVDPSDGVKPTTDPFIIAKITHSLCQQTRILSHNDNKSQKADKLKSKDVEEKDSNFYGLLI